MGEKWEYYLMFFLRKQENNGKGTKESWDEYKGCSKIGCVTLSTSVITPHALHVRRLIFQLH